MNKYSQINALFPLNLCLAYQYFILNMHLLYYLLLISTSEEEKNSFIFSILIDIVLVNLLL